MTKQRWISVLGFLAIAITIGAAARAQTAASSPASELGSVSGQLQSYSGDRLTILSKDGATMTFQVQDPKKLPENLQKGQNVRIDWKGTEQGDRVAVMVTPLDEPTGGASASASAMDDDGDDGDDGNGVRPEAGAASAQPTPATPQTSPTQQTASPPGSELPKTAGPLFLALVSGIAALAGGMGLNALRR